VVLYLDKTTLLSYQPSYYKNSKVIDNINNANANELNLVNSKITDVYNDCFSDTVSTTIYRLENELGITTNSQKTLQQRWNKIQSKMIGQGTITPQTIKSIAESYIEKVDVIRNDADYSFMLDLISTTGFPYVLEDLYDTIEEIKPAHLEANYQMTSKTSQVVSMRAFTLFGEEIQVFPYQIAGIESVGTINVGIGQTGGAEIISIQPKEE